MGGKVVCGGEVWIPLMYDSLMLAQLVSSLAPYHLSPYPPVKEEGDLPHLSTLLLPPLVRYYHEKMGCPPGPEQAKVVSEIVKSYVEGLSWVMRCVCKGHEEGGRLHKSEPLSVEGMPHLLM